MARRIFFKEQSSLGVAPNGYSIMGFNTSNRAIKTDESGVVRLIESVYTDESNTIVIGASGGTGSVSVNGYYQLPNYTPTSGQVLGLSGSSLHWITSGGGLSGAGTTNYLAKWNSGGLTGSVIFDNGTNVGIGTVSPSYRLHLLGTALSTAIETNSSTGQAQYNLINNAGNVLFIQLFGTSYGGGGGGLHGITYANNVIFSNTDSTGVTFGNTINKASNYYHFSSITATHAGYHFDTVGMKIGNNDTFTSANTARLNVVGSTSDSTAYALKLDNSSSSALLHVRNDGNVGIGIASPANKLDIHGGSGAVGGHIKVTSNDGSGSGTAYFYCENFAGGTTTINKTSLTQTGNLTGTSIPFAGIGLLNTLNSGGSYDPLVIGSSAIYSITNASGSGYGSRLDNVGLRIGLLSSLHTTNVNLLTVEGSTVIGGNFTNSAMLHVKGSTSDNTAYALKVDNSASSALLHVLNSGNIGINETAVSSTLLKITQPIGKFGLWINNGGTSTNGLLVYVNDTASTVQMIHNPGGTFAISDNLTDYVYFVGGASYRNAGFMVSNPTARVHIKGSTADSSAYALKVDNSSSSALLYVRNDGLVTIGDTTPAYANIFSIKKAQTSLLMVDIMNTNTANLDDAVLFIGQSTTKTSVFRYRNANNTENPYSSTMSMADTLQISATKTGTLDTGNIALISRRITNISSYIGVDGANTMLDQTGFKISNINSGLNSANTNLFEANGGVSYLKGSTSNSSEYALKVDNSSSSALLYVRNDGRVGVNSTPYGRLSVYGNDANNSDNPSGMSVIYQVGASDASLTFAVGSPLVTMWGIGIDNSDSDKFKISTNPTFDLGTSPAITIDPSNLYVGLNQASPSYPLHVVGKINSSVGFVVNGVDGAVSATFATVDGKTVTVSGGIITSVV